MTAKVTAIRGVEDILPADTPLWQFVETTVRQTLSGYGYGEIRLPIIERTELFKRSIGEDTDIVGKEMYTFESRGGTSLTLRPEGTASCVRAGIERGLLFNQQQRLWYQGPMFRYEKPQKGRYRQFHQIGVEAFGFAEAQVDAEQILLCARLWQALGLQGLKLELNSLGSNEARVAYRTLLVEYFQDQQAQLDEDSVRRLQSNPLRILDSKNPAMQTMISEAPSLADHLDTESAEHFAALREFLDDAGVSYQINPRLVRGLDYYNRTVFEWLTDRLGTQAAVCSGGRYDGLVDQLGGKATSAVGFAMGMERLIELLKMDIEPPTTAPQVCIVPLAVEAGRGAMQVAEQLRTQAPEIRAVNIAAGGKVKAVMKRADRSGAQYAVIVGQDELANHTVQVKNLRTLNTDQPGQQTIEQQQLAAWLRAALNPTE